ncbi:hypothetical protein O181_035067 [Austropuccinia psidii MF-1]|uniref:Uncharacterized protein n=1 Tax=Austropuccinia psidii MF-1 TaxID=1389203 RepID=A0A9Q3D4H5_9BASI|nr:hypothetical protein [Austropuccinia psidii MF-1]
MPVNWTSNKRRPRKTQTRKIYKHKKIAPNQNISKFLATNDKSPLRFHGTGPRRFKTIERSDLTSSPAKTILSEHEVPLDKVEYCKEPFAISRKADRHPDEVLPSQQNHGAIIDKRKAVLAMVDWAGLSRVVPVILPSKPHSPSPTGIPDVPSEAPVIQSDDNFKAHSHPGHPLSSAGQITCFYSPPNSSLESIVSPTPTSACARARRAMAHSDSKNNIARVSVKTNSSYACSEPIDTGAASSSALQELKLESVLSKLSRSKSSTATKFPAPENFGGVPLWIRQVSLALGFSPPSGMSEFELLSAHKQELGHTNSVACRKTSEKRDEISKKSAPEDEALEQLNLWEDALRTKTSSSDSHGSESSSNKSLKTFKQSVCFQNQARVIHHDKVCHNKTEEKEDYSEAKGVKSERNEKASNSYKNSMMRLESNRAEPNFSFVLKKQEKMKQLKLNFDDDKLFSDS